MIFEIRRVKNGHILKIVSAESGATESEEIVYQEKFDNEVECFADFLRYLNEEYGPSTSRYSEKRIYINIKSGDKFEHSALEKIKNLPTTKRAK